MSSLVDSVGEPVDWQAAWHPVIAQVGTTFDVFAARGSVSPDALERGSIRKYLEPLEFDCALHYDEDFAVLHGYPTIVAPYTAMTTFTLLPMWTPGAALFDSDDPDAQPARSSVKPVVPDYFPPFESYFSTDVEFDFMRPAFVGEVLHIEAGVLLSCEPKETSVGRGAFIKANCRIANQDGEVLAIKSFGSYYYTPKTGALS